MGSWEKSFLMGPSRSFVFLMALSRAAASLPSATASLHVFFASLSFLRYFLPSPLLDPLWATGTMSSSERFLRSSRMRCSSALYRTMVFPIWTFEKSWGRQPMIFLASSRSSPPLTGIWVLPLARHL